VYSRRLDRGGRSWGHRAGVEPNKSIAACTARARSGPAGDMVARHIPPCPQKTLLTSLLPLSPSSRNICLFGGFLVQCCVPALWQIAACTLGISVVTLSRTRYETQYFQNCTYFIRSHVLARDTDHPNADIRSVFLSTVDLGMDLSLLPCCPHWHNTCVTDFEPALRTEYGYNLWGWFPTASFSPMPSFTPLALPIPGFGPGPSPVSTGLMQFIFVHLHPNAPPRNLALDCREILHVVRYFRAGKNEGGGKQRSRKAIETVSAPCALWDPLVVIYRYHFWPTHL